MKFRDTSLITTFYTKDFGKVKAIAKGARETKSKYGAALQPMTYVDLVLYKKDNRELQLISQCDSRKVYKHIHSRIELMAVGLSLVELLDKVAHEEERHPELFSLIVRCLEVLESAEKNYRSILLAFEVRLAAEFGFAPSFQKCVDCAKPRNFFSSSELVLFHLDKGGFICPECTAKASKQGVHEKRIAVSHQTTIETMKVLELFLSNDLDSICANDYDEALGNEMDETLRLYLRHHFEGLKPLKSTEVFHQLLT